MVAVLYESLASAGADQLQFGVKVPVAGVKRPLGQWQLLADLYLAGCSANLAAGQAR